MISPEEKAQLPFRTLSFLIVARVRAKESHYITVRGRRVISMNAHIRKSRILQRLITGKT